MGGSRWGGRLAGTRSTRSRPSFSTHCSATSTWPRWTGSKVPPRIPTRRSFLTFKGKPCLGGFRRGGLPPLRWISQVRVEGELEARDDHRVTRLDLRRE